MGLGAMHPARVQHSSSPQCTLQRCRWVLLTPPPVLSLYIKPTAAQAFFLLIGLLTGGTLSLPLAVTVTAMVAASLWLAYGGSSAEHLLVWLGLCKPSRDRGEARRQDAELRNGDDDAPVRAWWGLQWWFGAGRKGLLPC